MPNKMIYVSDELSTLLKFEENASALICKLLMNYYAGNEPKEVIKMKISQAKSVHKLHKLALKKAEKEQEKQADLERIKAKSPDGSISELQIQAWEKKWQ